MGFFPEDLFEVLQKRGAECSAEQSYTKALLEKGAPAIIRKLIEEAGEVAGAAMEHDADHLAEEMADLWYHSLVVLLHYGLTPQQVQEKLISRRHASGWEK